MVGPRVVSYPAVDSLVGVACSLGAEFPNGPVVAMFGIEKGDEAVERVPVGSFGVCLAGTRAGGKTG